MKSNLEFASLPGLATGLLLLAGTVAPQSPPPQPPVPPASDSRPTSPWAGETPACSPEASYGGFQYRPAAAPDIAITTESQGLVKEEATDRVPARWADYSARFPGSAKRSGLAILAPPDHPGGAPGWPGLEKVTLAPGGKPLHLRYRVYVHRGDVAEGRVAEAYAAYARAHR